MSSPTPLTATHSLPPFPVDALPVAIGDEVAAVAEFTQTDPAMAGAMALAVLAACAGGRCELEVRPGWREPLNLFTAIVAEPGERKSAVLRTLVAPLLEAERQLVEASQERIVEAQTTRDIAAKAADKAKAMAGNAEAKDRESSAASAITAALQAERIVVPCVPRIVADDVTPEAAGSLMAEQHGRLAIISAEGGIFDIIAGRYSSNVPNLDVFLKGHAGDTLKVDRKGRAPEYIAQPALTVGVMIQPAVLTAIAKNGTMRGRGLLARFLYSLPPSKVGHRQVDAPVVPDATQVAYDDEVRLLATTLADWEDPAVLKLSPAGLDALVDFARTIEPQLQTAARLGHVKDWGSKLVGATARIAGLLHLGDDPRESWRATVEADSIDRAVRIADYFAAHALAAFDAMQADPIVADAQHLLEVIKRDGDTIISRRDLFARVSRSRFPKAADLDEPIARLLEHGWLDPLPAPDHRGPGRPPSPKWHVHRQLHAAETAQAAEPVCTCPTELERARAARKMEVPIGCSIHPDPSHFDPALL